MFATVTRGTGYRHPYGSRLLWIQSTVDWHSHSYVGNKPENATVVNWLKNAFSNPGHRNAAELSSTEKPNVKDKQSVAFISPYHPNFGLVNFEPWQARHCQWWWPKSILSLKLSSQDRIGINLSISSQTDTYAPQLTLCQAVSWLTNKSSGRCIRLTYATQKHWYRRRPTMMRHCSSEVD